MTKLTTLLAGALLTAAATLTPAQAAPKIALVDANKMIGESMEGKKTLEALQVRYAEEETKAKAEQEKIQALIEDLKKKGDTLSPEARAEKEEEINTKGKKFERLYQATGQRLEAMKGRTLGALEEKLGRFLMEWAKKNGYDLLLEGRAAIYASASLDVTDAALKAYNEAYIAAGQPPVKIDDPQAAPAPAPAAASAPAPAPKSAPAPKKKP